MEYISYVIIKFLCRCALRYLIQQLIISAIVSFAQTLLFFLIIIDNVCVAVTAITLNDSKYVIVEHLKSSWKYSKLDEIGLSLVSV